MRFFLCDDNPQYRALARLVLERAGHEIVGEAADGRQAIAQAPPLAPDVVLLDINMPRVNGLDALPRLRARLPDARIVVLTTGQVPYERRQAMEAGADGYVVKPQRVFALEDEIRAVLEATD